MEGDLRLARDGAGGIEAALPDPAPPGPIHGNDGAAPRSVKIVEEKDRPVRLGRSSLLAIVET